MAFERSASCVLFLIRFWYNCDLLALRRQVVSPWGT